MKSRGIVLAVDFDGTLALGDSFPNVENAIPNEILIKCLRDLRLTESPRLQPWDDENSFQLGKVFADCYKLIYDKSSWQSSYQG